MKGTFMVVLCAILVLCVAACASQSNADITTETTDGNTLSSGVANDTASAKSIAVNPIDGSGLDTGDDAELQMLIRASIAADFQRYTDFSIEDSANTEAVIEEQKLQETDQFADTGIEAGNLLKAQNLVEGSLRKNGSSYTLELSVIEVESGKQIASFLKGGYSFDAIRYLTAVKEGTLDLITQLGISLTSGEQEALLGTESNEVKAIELSAQLQELRRQNASSVGIIALTEQIKQLDPRLAGTITEAIPVVNINTGNAGRDLRADAAWRKDWIKILTDAEAYFVDFFKTYIPYYVIVYSDVTPGATDYTKGTVPMSFNVYAVEYMNWTPIVTNTVNAIQRGLEATKRRTAWKLPDWPKENITKTRPFVNGNKNYIVTAELLNSKGKILGRKTFTASSSWTITTGPTTTMTSSIQCTGGTGPNNTLTVTFSDVNANDLDDTTKIRWLAVNGKPVTDKDRAPLLTFMPVEEWQTLQNRGGDLP
ncbi:MAG: hypothetical protein LBM77_03755 [Spirochaetaceae bacterium]|jgi:hypothetical protein|nr:hypothetical protein [Spirochaetaceae bacterium]